MAVKETDHASEYPWDLDEREIVVISASVVDLTHSLLVRIGKKEGERAVPKSLHKISRFAKLPAAARRTILRELVLDSTFRTHVAKHATELPNGDTLTFPCDQLLNTTGDDLTEFVTSLRQIVSSGESSTELSTEQASTRQTLNEHSPRETGFALVERDELQNELAEARITISQLENMVSELAETLDALRTERDEKTAQRHEAVKQLKDTERILHRRNSELHALKQPAAEDVDATPFDPERDAQVVKSLNEISREFVEFSRRIDHVAMSVRSPANTDNEMGSTRSATRMFRGLSEDSVEGLTFLVEQRDVVVFVDGYNVSLLLWPNADLGRQRELLISKCESLPIGDGGQWRLLFDGTHDEFNSGNHRTVKGSPVSVSFTPHNIEADDAILEGIDSVATPLPVLVISSDKRVQDGARMRGANVVSSFVLGRSS